MCQFFCRWLSWRVVGAQCATLDVGSAAIRKERMLLCARGCLGWRKYKSWLGYTGGHLGPPLHCVDGYRWG